METLIGKTLGGCTLNELIGQGGMGSVYKAHHQTLDITVAVKVLHSFADMPGSQERFLREAQIAARLNHPNIVTIMNAGVEQGYYFIVMEYVRGSNLLKVIEDKGKLSVDRVIAISLDILHALDAALVQNVVHRDIKPENILIDNTGKAKLTDLGLAKALSGQQNLTQSSTILGSPHYIAPEQADNPSAVDCRSDIYSLGCTMYHMLSGKAPFPGKSIVEIVMHHVKTPVPDIRDIDKSIPDFLAECIFTMMQKDPSKRYAAPSEVVNALECRKSTVTPSVRAFTPSSVIKGKTTRKSNLTIVTAVLLLLLLVGYFQFIGQMRHITKVTAIQTADTLSGKHDSVATPKSDSTDMKQKSAAKKRTVYKMVPVTTEDNVSTIAKSGENPLIAVVKIGDTQGLKAMLSKGISPKCDPSAATTPLHEAVRRGLSNETELLVKAGADIDACDKAGNTALHYAVKENAQLIVKLLLDNGANPNIKDRSGKTPLQMAEGVDSDLEQLLEQHGAK